MKQVQLSFKEKFRLLTLMLCMAMAVPQLHAATYTVAGSDATALGTTWAQAAPANDMAQYSGNWYYLVKSVTYSSGTTYEYKITVDHSWNTSYGDNGGGSNASYTVNAGTGYVCYAFNSSTHVPHVVSSCQTVVIAGSDTQALGSSWSGTDTNNSMTTTDGVTYTLTRQVNYTSGGTMECKAVVASNQWYGNSSGGNVSYSITGAGTWNVTYTFDAVTGIVTVDVQSAAPVTPDYYITGDNGLGIPNGWSYNQLTTMTYDDVNDVYTYSYNVTTAGTYYFAFADGIGSSWDDFGANHRFGPASGNETVTLGSWAPTQKGAGSYAVTVEAGQVTITLDVANMRYKVEGTAPVVIPDYYVVGDNALIGHNWDIASDTKMTETSGTYTWSRTGVHLTAGNYSLKVKDSNGTWYGNSIDNGNVVVNAGVNGTYDLEVTFDSSTGVVTATLTNTAEDESYTYDIYMRYTGSENLDNVFIYAWDSYGTLSAAWDENTGGTAWSSLTSQTINGYTYYHVTYTSYASTINVIFNENGSSSTQTADLTATPGDNYFTYGGGSTVDGPNDAADTLPKMYLIGYANAQRWAANAGIEMTYVAETGYYVLENVVLTANSQFAFATQLGSTSTDWTGLDAHRLSSTGDNHWAITGEDWISYQNYVDDNHNWYVTQSGSYRVEIDPANHKVRVIPSHESMYISYGVNWTYANNSEQMTTVDGNTYQITVTLNNGDYFLFSTAKHDTTAWGATQPGFEITDLMLGQTQTLVKDSINNFHFTGTTGKYVVVVNKEKGTVIIRKTVDAKEKTLTKIYLQKTDNVTLDPAGGTYHSQVLEGKRGGIFAWNKLNLSNGGGYYTVCQDGPSNYTYDNEVENDYGGNGYLNDLQDTTTMDGKQWYAWSVSNSICEFYFIRNNKTDHKSQNVMRRAGEVWLTWTDLKATTNCQTDAVECDSLQDVTRNYYAVSASGVSDCATMLEGHYYVYYTNTTGWDSVYCYAWNETPLVEFTGTYPGSKCTFVGYDDNGYEVWCYDFGLMADVIAQYGRIPSNVIFNNGRGAASEGAEGDKYRQQTGDMPFNNGACYDYLGLIYLGNSLNAIINSGIVNGPKYTVEDDLMGVYYDDNAVTEILLTDENGQPVLENGEYQYIEVVGALYAKDFENYSAKSRQPDGTTDYVYEICAHRKTSTFPGGSQVQLKREYYDQSNWVKIVLSPNFDNANAKSNGDVTIEAEKFDKVNFSGAQSYNGGYLSQYVGKIIPGHSMSGNLANNVNPQMHITNIAKPEDAPAYEKNVYITTHFNDSVVFSYVHQDWSPGEYKGVYKTKPIMGYNDKGEQIVAETVVDSTKLYKMFYVAPKPQEVAYITWAVFHHDNPNGNIGVDCDTEPDDPGEFRVPMNWNRKGQLWDGSAINPADPDAADAQAAWGTTYGPFSNGYMQYGAFQVNWSLFEGMDIVDDHMTGRPQEPWYRIFKPGQAYKILAIIRYAYGDNLNDREYSAGVYKGNGYNEGNDPERPNHVSNAPRRANDTWADIMYAPYDNLNKSKFIVFPLLGSNEDSNGSGIGNVTTVKEVVAERTVVNVSYYNLMGVHSDKPFDGLNIVVTTYSDGSRTSKKILR